MNSSVTWDSATSVTSSLCLLIRLSSRSKGPSKLARRTAKPARAAASGPSAPGASPGASARSVIRPCSLDAPPGSSLGDQPLHQHAVVTVGLEVGQRDREGLPDEPAAVDGQPLVTSQREPGVLDVEQLVRGDVDGHLLVVTHAAARLAWSSGPALLLLGFVADCGHRPVAAEQVVRGRQAHTSRQRTATSLASWR